MNTTEKPAIQRKQIDLDTETIIALTTQAIRAGKSLKPYIEDVLMAQAKPKSYLVSLTDNEDGIGIDECHAFRAEDGDALQKATERYNEALADNNCTWAVLSTIVKSTDY